MPYIGIAANLIDCTLDTAPYGEIGEESYYTSLSVNGDSINIDGSDSTPFCETYSTVRMSFCDAEILNKASPICLEWTLSLLP